MEPSPEVVELDYKDLQAKLDRIEASLGAELAQPFRQLLAWYATLLGLLQEKTISIQRLRKMIFGSSTERTSQVLSSGSDSANSTNTADAANTASDGQSANERPDAGARASDPPSPNAKPQRRRKGHGRTPAEAYTGCAKVFITHATWHPGDACPHCAHCAL